ncbi:hypothetical protein [Actinoplanes sp. NBRC 103695]|uniref:hypothetical protein n=1 Tax=Actinoplanes sp. NBRC 103695 TaxID=3032202 RepID=UPI0024A18FDC|nr:hypothetical protein [Actinoplanes sp. NBRC 103695]GLY94390.1 hypothetical protein Acsp02_16460 [Actinoplanes sp. NBRC 103695]
MGVKKRPVSDEQGRASRLHGAVQASFAYGDPGALQPVLSLAGLLGAVTVVRGVTSDAQAAALRGTTATAAQGPCVGLPVPVDQLVSVIAA